MRFLRPSEYQPFCNERFSYYRKVVTGILPQAIVEHIGASAIPNAISKGDLDIFVGVDAAEFESTVLKIIDLGFQEKQDTLRTDELCMLESKHEDVAIQMVANGSKFEDFLVFRDALLADSALVEQYNQLKKSCEGCSEGDYRERKSVFITKVLSEAYQ